MRSRRRLMQTLLTATRNDQLHYLSKSVLLEAVDTYFKLDHLARIKTIETISSELDVDFNFGQCALAARQTMSNFDFSKYIPNAIRTAQALFNPAYNRLFLALVHSGPRGIALLLSMRNDMQKSLSRDERVLLMSDHLKHLLSIVFSPTSLELRKISLTSTPPAVLQSIMKFEAVHTFTGFDDLKQRSKPSNICVFSPCNWRRTFGNEFLPLFRLIFSNNESSQAFVQVALVNEVSSSVQAVLTSIENNESESYIHAIFYSITSPQPGLAGIDLGNMLIKAVVARLQEESKCLHTFCTLSPLPGFRQWLLARLSAPQIPGSATDDLAPAARALLSSLSPNWPHEDTLATSVQPLLLRLCARYLLQVKRGRAAADAVANFHLRNGAQLHRLNWRGDVSAKGFEQSFGIMVNYKYELDRICVNQRAYQVDGVIDVHENVRRWL